MKIYLISPTEQQALIEQNSSTATYVPVDHGMGTSIEQTVIENPIMVAHKAALESIKPLSERELVEVKIAEGTS